MMYAFIRLWAKIFLRLYFRKTLVYGAEKVPATGPLILASNHPSAFMEAAILATVMKRPIHFLVRGDMFHPRFKWLFDATKQIPIYRKKDGITNLRKNASSFDLTYRKLAEGESVLIFPEAKTTLEKKMRPIQRGTAHLAFGTLPFLKNGSELKVQPVGVNYMDPRVPGTDVVIRFTDAFVVAEGTREDRDTIEAFTDQLSNAMSPLIVQVDDSLEKNYDVLAAIYLRMIDDNTPEPDAVQPLHKISNVLQHGDVSIGLQKDSDIVLKLLKASKNPEAVYFPDLVALNKFGLAVMALLKLVWLVAGGWIWRLVRGIIFNKIRTNTFQGPTSLGAMMVVMPLMALILLLILMLFGVPGWYVLFWLFVMWLGTLIRPALPLILKLIMMNSNHKLETRNKIIALRKQIENHIL
ncbi:MAG: 1-acyl-sn-glycerol-3-phosphate acyltransferase [Saprospiraceae bacterium]|nr:1-acyl-sn-glycerol-3-phosphate acyltransferase [Saprospiraceae bacterium]